MTAKRWDGASWVDLTTRKFWNGTSWVDLTVAKYWNGTSWVDITFAGGGGGALSATADRSGVVRLEFDPEPAPSTKTLTTANSVTVTPSGGGGSPTYAWTKLSGDSGPYALTPTSATTFFRCVMSKNSTKTAVWRCTVTDGAETAHVDINVFFEYVNDV